MGPKRAKRYFPLIGSLSLFIVFGNFFGLIPGFTPPTSNWNITLGCAAIVFVMFNYYGIRRTAWYFKHLFGPWLGWPLIPVNLLFVMEPLFALHPSVDAQHHSSDAQHGGRPPPRNDRTRHERAVPACCPSSC